ncbi:MAG: hypothetical protein IKR87_06105 [Candidatus Methanomethylophilaceae archaeon]|nr:hypothetical protein [Candidatus Methanomethylophilaceae archaeon]
MTLSDRSTELVALRAEFLDLMESMPENPAEARSAAQRMEEIRTRIQELSSEEGPSVPEVRSVDSRSVSEEISSVSSEIASIKARIQEALSASDFELAGKLSMEASLLESRRRSLEECLKDLS